MKAANQSPLTTKKRQAAYRSRLKDQGKREILLALSEAVIKRVDEVAKHLGKTRSEAVESMIKGSD